MSEITYEMEDVMRRCHGLYVGMLDEREMEVFDLFCERGLASRSYEGPGGFMGLAKVRLGRVWA